MVYSYYGLHDNSGLYDNLLKLEELSIRGKQVKRESDLS